jgi:sugar/nucleoside kinase (ribokinase family)
MTYAAVLGEALIDLLEGECEGEPVYRPAVGGAPFNVAVAVARLGGAAEFVGSVSTDALGERLHDFLVANGVGVGGVRRVAIPTTLAVATFTGAEPHFAFYGDSHGRLGPDDLDADRLAGAGVIYTGSIAMLREPTLAAARAAWAVPGPRKVFDPNARPRLLDDVAAYRAVVEEFAATADLVKLSAADADVLWGADAATVAARLAGPATVVVTLGAAGALVRHEEELLEIPAPKIRPVDTTGAGDSVMGALIAQLLATDGEPDWAALVRYALAVGALTCERPGGATALPTAAEVAARFPA